MSGTSIIANFSMSLTTGALQIYGKRYDVHNNVAYIITKV